MPNRDPRTDWCEFVRYSFSVIAPKCTDRCVDPWCRSLSVPNFFYPSLSYKSKNIKCEKFETRKIRFRCWNRILKSKSAWSGSSKMIIFHKNHFPKFSGQIKPVKFCLICYSIIPLHMLDFS